MTQIIKKERAAFKIVVYDLKRSNSKAFSLTDHSQETAETIREKLQSVFTKK